MIPQDVVGGKVDNASALWLHPRHIADRPSMSVKHVIAEQLTPGIDQMRQTRAEQNARVVAVYAGETYLGLVSMEDIAEVFAVVAFLQRQQEARKGEEARTSS
jgi:hypothetical protein